MPDHRDFDDWRLARRRGGGADAPVPVPLGLVETVAAKTRARYDYWTDQYLDLVRRFCSGVVPPRAEALAARFARERAWEVPDDFTPGMTTIHYAGGSFTVPTSEVLPCKKTT